MGLRKWVSRPLRGRKLGVENLIAGGDGIPVGGYATLEPPVSCTVANTRPRNPNDADGLCKQSTKRLSKFGSLLLLA